jgi:hypothetical protein
MKADSLNWRFVACEFRTLALIVDVPLHEVTRPSHEVVRGQGFLRIVLLELVDASEVELLIREEIMELR